MDERVPADAAWRSEDHYAYVAQRNVALSEDTVKDYLHLIGGIAVLEADVEVELAKRIESGLFAEKLLLAWPFDPFDGEANDDTTISVDASHMTHEVPDHPSVDDTDKEDVTFQEKAAVVEALQKLLKQSDDPRQLYRDLRQIQSEGSQAFDFFVHSNLRLVIQTARKHSGRGLTFDNVIQEGNDGLVHAVRKFDYALGYKFSTYAPAWMRQRINVAIHEQKRTIRLPRRISESIDRYYASVSELAKKGIEATPEAIASDLDIPIEFVLELREYRQTLSLDKGLGEEDDGFTLGENLVFNDGENPETIAMSRFRSDALYQLLDSLETGQRLVITSLYGLDGKTVQTTEEIAARYKWTEGHVKHLLRGALEQLREQASARDLGSFLLEA